MSESDQATTTDPTPPAPETTSQPPTESPAEPAGPFSVADQARAHLTERYGGAIAEHDISETDEGLNVAIQSKPDSRFKGLFIRISIQPSELEKTPVLADNMGELIIDGVMDRMVRAARADWTQEMLNEEMVRVAGQTRYNAQIDQLTADLKKVLVDVEELLPGSIFAKETRQRINWVLSSLANHRT